jgi:hypothetical protein
LQWAVAIDLEQTLAKLTKLLDELRGVIRGGVRDAPEDRLPRLLLEQVQLMTHLHIKFLKLKQARFWQITMILSGTSFRRRGIKLARTMR